MEDGSPALASDADLLRLVSVIRDYAIFMLRPDGTVSSWNEGARALKGYAAAEILGESFRTFYSPEDRANLLPERLLARALAEGRCEHEGWRVRKDGSRFWANVVLTAVRDAGGALTGFAKITRDLTERKRSEDALREAQAQLETRVRERTAELAVAEKRYRQIVETIGEALWVVGPAGETVFVNERFAKLMRGTASELIGRHMLQLLEESEGKAALERWREREAGHGGEVELQLRRLDGSMVWVSASSAPVLDEAGQFNGTVVLLTDITERRRGEEARKRLANIVQSSTDPIWSVDRQGTITSWNRAAERVFGYTPEEAIGQPVTLLATFDQADELREVEVRLLAGAPRIELNTWRRRKDGELVELALTVSIFINANGEPERSVVAHDLTGERAAASALQESEHRMRSALDGMIEGYTVIDREWRYRYVNEAGARQARMSKEAMIGRSPLDLVPGFRQSSIFAAIDRCMVEREPSFAEEEMTFPDGSKSWLELTIQPVPEGILVHSTDATERRRAKELHEQLELQLRHAQKMEAVGRLAGGVAHDFNNVLSVILSYAEMIRQDLQPGEIYDDLGEIVKASKRAAKLTQQLLLFSRHQAVGYRAVDLNELITNLEKMLCRVVGEDVEVNIATGEHLGYALADVGNLEQVLMNLVVNARDAMPLGGKIFLETANVEVAPNDPGAPLGLKPGPHVMVSMRDTGCGMDAATLARIFEPFFTTKEKGKGTGLGLATVFGIVQQHGGAISVQSAPGAGTTFKIYLPRVEASSEAQVSTGAPLRLTGSETLLLVEDEEQVRTIAQNILKRAGYHVLAARNGDEALRLAKERGRPIDLLVTDIVMPAMSGPVLARQIAALLPDTKVLFMSGYTDDTVSRHGVIESELAYLQKPFTPEMLLAKVRRVLESPAGALTARAVLREPDPGGANAPSDSGAR